MTGIARDGFTVMITLFARALMEGDIVVSIVGSNVAIAELDIVLVLGVVFNDSDDISIDSVKGFSAFDCNAIGVADVVDVDVGKLVVAVFGLFVFLTRVNVGNAVNLLSLMLLHASRYA